MILLMVILVIGAAYWVWIDFRPRSSAERILEPILDLGAAAHATGFSYEKDSPARKLEDSLERLAKDPSPAADEASAMLLGYYLGEHNGEMQLCIVTSRGQRELPLVERYRSDPPSILKPQYESMRLRSESRNVLFDQAIDAIRNRRVECD